MPFLKALQKKLDATFGAGISLTFSNRILTLHGTLPTWQDVVQAGRMCAKPKAYTIVNDLVAQEASAQPMIVPSVQDSTLEGKHFDAVVVGGGVVGCAIARELARYKMSILLLEKECDVALHASSRNDGMVHPGIDLHRGTLKQKYNSRGNALYPQLCAELGVPFRRTGQVIGLTQRWAPLVLPFALAHWHSMGLACRIVSRKELLAMEPALTKDVRCGLSFPTAGIVCPYGLTIAYAENAVENGVTLSLDTAVTGMTLESGRIAAVHTNRGTLQADIVINAAGVYSEEIARMAGDRFFSIHPRKGTNAILDKKAAVQIKTIASMLGSSATKTQHTKGGGLVSTVDGNLLVGPDATETPHKEDFSTEKRSIDATFAKQRHALPTLSTGDIITYFTGVRAPTYEEDFVICKGKATQNLLHAAGIQSPGLTAAPAIAQDIAAMAAEMLQAGKNEHFTASRTPIVHTASLAVQQRDALIAQNPDYGVIVCRCEEVSRGEIVDALHRAVPCRSVDGVKRRVRPGMGRCQGGFCGPLVAQIIAEELHLPLEEILKNGENSVILYGSTKKGGVANETGTL